MNLLAWLWVAPLAVILVGGALWAAAFSPASSLRFAGRGWRLTPRLEPAFGRISGCILVLAAGAGLSIAIVWPVGYWARNFNASDHKVYNWVLPRAHLDWLHSTMRLLTEMSNNRQTQVVAAFFMMALTIVWFFRRRGLVVLAPAVLILAAYEIEHQLQHTLKLLAARTGPAPAGLGAFPSGGCARLICVYGLIVYLVLRAFGKTRSKIAILAWTALAAATYTEAYSRLYLGKHWISDIIGGLVLGVVLLAVFIAAAKMLDRPDRNDEVTEVVAIGGTSAAIAAQAELQAQPEPAAELAADPSDPQTT
ncbi:MAG TPA: phosphatase PAP2 family protein [Frankiaceae bacterium]|jgi:membrane-associated phospholipid phosphatase|nr:phosphatase PAP2 family protein [Frankiaceae bacterium]